MSTKQEISRLRTLQESFSELVTEVVAKFRDIFNAITGIADRLGTPVEGDPQTIMDAVRFEAGRFQRDVDLLAARFREVGVDIREGATFAELIEDVREYKFQTDSVEYDSARYSIGDILLCGLGVKRILSKNADKVKTLFSQDTSIEEVIAENATTLGASFIRSTIKKFIGPNVTSIAASAFKECSKLEEAYVPSLYANLNTDIFYSCTNLKTLNILNYNGGTGCWPNCINLIDVIIGESLQRNFNFANTPTNAHSKTSRTLVPNEVLDLYPNNNSYWNYCLREHFAANLQDRSQESTKYTITFGTTNLSAMEQATKDAFTSKGWALA